MKKGLMILGVLILLIAGGAWYMLSGAGDFIRAQIEEQGSKYLGAPVSLVNVDLALTEGRLTLSGLKVKNPQGFSNEDAFNFDSITLDLGELEKHVRQNSPSIRADGIRRILAGQTSLEEVLRVTRED